MFYIARKLMELLALFTTARTWERLFALALFWGLLYGALSLLAVVTG